MRCVMFLHLVLYWSHCIMSTFAKKTSSNCNLNFHVKVLISVSARMSQVKDLISGQIQERYAWEQPSSKEKVRRALSRMRWKLCSFSLAGRKETCYLQEGCFPRLDRMDIHLLRIEISLPPRDAPLSMRTFRKPNTHLRRKELLISLLSSHSLTEGNPRSLPTCSTGGTPQPDLP